MLKWIARLFVTGVVILWAISGWCEYYQYKDENGVLRFTDNLVSVPPDQRPGVTTHRSVKSSMETRNTATPAEKTNPRSRGLDHGETLPAGNTWEGKKARKIAEFDRKQSELDQTFQALQKEKAKLMKEVPSEKASFEEKAIYNRKVSALNAKIDRYEETLAAFNKQVTDYNAKIKKK